MGLTKMGTISVLSFPHSVGFTSGIAVTIFSTQMKDFFGFSMDVPAGFIPQWICYFSNIASIDWIEAAMSIGCLLIIIVWGRYVKKIPGSLIALIA
ncbi:sulfate transporter, partial [gut metagenome]